MWGRLSSLAQNPNLASLSKLTKDGIGQLHRITNDVLAEVQAVETRGDSAHSQQPGERSPRDRHEGDGWFGESDEEEEGEAQAAPAPASAPHANGGHPKARGGEEFHEGEKRKEVEEPGAVPVESAVEVELHSAEEEASTEAAPTPSEPLTSSDDPPQSESFDSITSNADALEDDGDGDEREREEAEGDAEEEKEPHTPVRLAPPTPITSSPVSPLTSSTTSKSAPSTPPTVRQPSTPPTTSPSFTSPAELHRLQQQVATLTAKLAAEGHLYQQEAAAHSETKARVDELSARLEEERNSHARSREGVEALQRLADEREDEVALLTERLERMREDWEQEKETAQAEVEELHEKLREQQRMLMDQEGRLVKEAEGKQREEEGAVDPAASSDAAYAEMITGYLAEQARLEGELEEMREKYEQALATAKQPSSPPAHSAETATTTAAVDEQRLLREEVEALQAQLEERDHTVSELQTELQERTQQVEEHRQSLQRMAELEAELQQAVDQAGEATTEKAQLCSERDGLQAQLQSRDADLLRLTAELEERQQQAEQERQTLLQRLQEAQATQPTPSPPPPTPNVDQSAMISQLHATVEKLRRIIHRLTTERNDVLTVIQSVQNGLISFAETNHIDVQQDDAQAATEEAGRKENEEERRRKVQALVDSILAGVQLRLDQAAAASSVSEPVAAPPSYSPPLPTSAPPSPSLTALSTQVFALQSALAVERETTAARQAELDKLRRVKDDMIQWKEKASTAMAKLKEEKDRKEKALAAEMREKEEQWEQRWSIEEQQREQQLDALNSTVAQLQEQLQAAISEAAQAKATVAAPLLDPKAEETAALLAMRESEMESLRGTIAEYSSQLQALRVAEADHVAKLTSLEASSTAAHHLQEQLAQLSSTLTALTEEKAELNLNIQHRDSSLQILRTQLTVAREEAAGRISALETETKEQRARVVDLERELAEERERTERGWEERDEQWKAREDDYAVEREGYTQQIEALQMQLSDVQEEMKTEMVRQREALEGKVREATRLMEEERKREKRERILLEGRIRELLEERERERREQEEELTRLRAGGEDRQRHEEQLGEKERSLQQLREERKADHVAHLHAVKALRDELEALKAQHAELLQRLGEQGEVERELQTAIAQREEQLRTLQVSATALQQRDEEREAEIAQLQGRVAEAERASERVKAHMKEATAIIRTQYDEALQEIERQSIDLDNLRAAEEKGKAVAELCEQLSYQLEQKEGECRANVEALNNLQLVLEQVQAEQDHSKGQLEADIAQLREQLQSQQDTERQLHEAQQMVVFLESNVTSLRSDLLSSHSALAAATHEAEALRASFASTVERLRGFGSDEHQIDRRLVVKLLVTYFERGQKEDTLHLMYRMLGLTEEEKERVERGRKGKGLGGRLYGLTSYVSYLSPFDAASSSVKVDTEDATLADLWVEFLLKEAKEQNEHSTAAKLGGGGEGGQPPLQQPPNHSQSSQEQPSTSLTPTPAPDSVAPNAIAPPPAGT